MKPLRAPSRRQQHGFVLAVALVLLVVMTLFALAAVRLSSQEEKMASFAYDRGLAFQAAEAALRTAESAVEVVKPTLPASTVATATGSECETKTSGTTSVKVCPPPLATQTRWTDSAFTAWTSSTTVGTGTLAVTPEYIVEYLGNTFPCNFDPSAPTNCKRYRITARVRGSGRAATMLQSVYATD